MLKFHSVLGKIVIYFMFFICFFGSLACFQAEFIKALNPSIKGASSEQALIYLLKSYEHSSVLSIKDLGDGAYELAHFNGSDSKKVKKSSRELFGETGASAYKDGSFFKAIHFKFYPTHNWFRNLGKAFSTAAAVALIVTFIVGIFLLKRKDLFRLSSPKERGRLHLAHVNFGILAGVFLFVFCLSGIGLNYLNDINNLFKDKNQQTTKSNKVKKPANKEISFKLNDEQISAILDDFSAAKKDAIKRLNTDKLEVLSLNRAMFIIRPANEFKSTFKAEQNSATLMYKGAKLVKESYTKKADSLTNIYNFFYDIHRLHSAAFWLRALVAIAAMLSCVFMIYSLKLFAFNKAKNYQAIFLACSISCGVYLLMLIADLNLFNAQIFWAVFIISLIASRFLSAKTSLKIGIVFLLPLLYLCLKMSFYLAAIGVIWGYFALRSNDESKQA